MGLCQYSLMVHTTWYIVTISCTWKLPGGERERFFLHKFRSDWYSTQGRKSSAQALGSQAGHMLP